LAKSYPAVDVAGASSDLLLAFVDDFAPTAIEERDEATRIFFATDAERDRAFTAIVSRFDVTSIDIPDEDWARRSQENLQPITVGRITVAPPWAASRAPVPAPQPLPSPQSPATSHQPLVITIEPSMGFGTGHHATTRLCLAALQAIDLTGAVALDVGTGSGVLAIAADRLGAARAYGIDCDADAIRSARENLTRNPQAARVTFDVGDLTTAALPPADVVTANLTGALLVRSASTLAAAVAPGGSLIVSGLLAHERADVVAAYAPTPVVWEREEDGWVALTFRSLRAREKN
jgi:ribosomal protein L11 methyltransferase